VNNFIVKLEQLFHREQFYCEAGTIVP